MPKLTVILPVLNGANYLERSISSVLNQNFRHFELLVLDGGSTDATLPIAQGTGDSRVQVCTTHAGLGLFERLNLGIREARAPLVRFWAHDDIMLPECLAAFYRAAEAWPKAGLYYCSFYQIDSKGARTGHEQLFEGCRRRTPDLAENKLSALLFYCYGCLPGNISTVMLRKEAWEAVGGFQEGFQQSPDYDMWIRISDHFPVAFLREKLVEVRCHAGQLSGVGMREMTTVEQELSIFQMLRQRLDGVVSDRELEKFWRQQRGRQHIHWLAKAILRGNWAAARRGWCAIRQYDQPWRQVLYWVFSLNGRLFTPSGDQFFDSRVKWCLSGSTLQPLQ